MFYLLCKCNTLCICNSLIKYNFIFFQSIIYNDLISKCGQEQSSCKFVIIAGGEPSQFCWGAKPDARLYWFHPQNSHFGHHLMSPFDFSSTTKRRKYFMATYLFFNDYIFFNNKRNNFILWIIFNIFSSMFPIMIHHLCLFSLPFTHYTGYQY